MLIMLPTLNVDSAKGNNMSSNPLKQYFRQPGAFIKLPTLSRWYTPHEIELNEEGELEIYGLTAVDSIMLNTPDAMLNGKALETVIKNCAPGIKNVKKIFTPDLDLVFLAIKSASGEGKYDIDRNCPKCNEENTFEVNCNHIINTCSYVEDSDTVININNELMVYIKPYTFDLRLKFLHRQYEQNRVLEAIDNDNKELNDFQKSEVLSDSIKTLTASTFDLLSSTIEKIVIIQSKQEVTNHEHINEWVTSTNKQQAELLMNHITKLNQIGPNKKVEAKCIKCEHVWEEELSFDPISFFGKR